jgi:uncharacterized damage-inducible protein DinB
MMQRTEPPLVAGEREMLRAYLDYQRATLSMKCDGLTADQLRQQKVPPSSLSLLGLVRHMTDVERGWFSRRVGRANPAFLYCTEANPDGDFDDVLTADVDEALAAWQRECAQARQVEAAVASFDETFPGRTRDYSLRWIMVHMIEEYARHNGHADLLRERIDGVTGE